MQVTCVSWLCPLGGTNVLDREEARASLIWERKQQEMGWGGSGIPGPVYSPVQKAMQTLEACEQVGVLGLGVLCDTITGKNRCALSPNKLPTND